MNWILARLILALLLVSTAGLPRAAAQTTREGALAPLTASERVGVHLFWTPECPHCLKAKAFLERLVKEDSRVELRAIELGQLERNAMAFEAVVAYFRIEPPAVPVIVIGKDAIVGFGDDATTGVEIKNAIAACRASQCEDVAAALIERVSSGAGPPEASSGAASSATQSQRRTVPETINIPLLGAISTSSLSLPALTIVLGAVDGFNPCAMWVLVFLVGLLIGIEDKVRMWTYGIVFLVTSAAVYFAFMAAWLNVFLFLGSLAWIRMGIGVFALGAGAYYLREFVRNPNAACAVTSPGQRQRVMDRLKLAVSERSFLIAIASIVVLAVSVNVIELLCSAGIPAIYTQVLALNELSAAAHYAYLALYISVFLLDDVIVFATAMLTLQASGLAATYSRYSHLIGGIVLGVIGLLLLLRPEWLALA